MLRNGDHWLDPASSGELDGIQNVFYLSGSQWHSGALSVGRCRRRGRWRGGVSLSEWQESARVRAGLRARVRVRVRGEMSPYRTNFGR